MRQTELEIKKIGHEVGFDLVGIASVDDPNLIEAAKRYENWLKAGHAASMDYLSRHGDQKKNPAMVFSPAQSVICVGLNYSTSENFSDDETKPEISIYTRGVDYHELLQEKLKSYSAKLKQQLSIGSTAFVDIQPVFERFWAWRSGLGWIGKNAMLINRKKGSYFFLGGLFTDATLVVDEPDIDHCGRCRKCIDACPTEAILPDRQIESGKCIAYHTIENRGEVPAELMPKFGRWVAGCDICQRVCPWNEPSSGEKTEEAIEFQKSNPAFGETFENLALWDLPKFKLKTKGIAMSRMKYHGFLRNLAIATSNAKISEKTKLQIFEKISNHAVQIEKPEYKTVVLKTLEKIK